MDNKQTMQNILQALMTISTKGNDTITMANCMQALQQVIKNTPDSATVETTSTEPEVVGE